MPSGNNNHLRRNPYVEEDHVLFSVQDYANKRAMRIFVITASIMFLLIIGLIFIYLPGTRDRSQPPRIETDNAPYKVELENPGGEIVPNQDKSVYEVMTGAASEHETVTPKLTEEPLDLGGEPLVLPGSVPIEVQEAVPVQAKPQGSASESVPIVTKPAVPVSAGGGDYVVQVASVRSKAAAQDIWQDMEGNSQMLPSGSYADIKRVNLENKGVFYRLRVAGLQDKASANKLCDQLKAQNQACFVTRK